MEFSYTTSSTETTEFTSMSFRASYGNLDQLGRAVVDVTQDLYITSLHRVLVTEDGSGWPGKIVATYQDAVILGPKTIMVDGQIIELEGATPSYEIFVRKAEGIGLTAVRLTPAEKTGLWFHSTNRVVTHEDGTPRFMEYGRAKGNLLMQAHPRRYSLVNGPMNRDAEGRRLQTWQVASKHVYLAAWAVGLNVEMLVNDPEKAGKLAAEAAEREAAYFARVTE